MSSPMASFKSVLESWKKDYIADPIFQQKYQMLLERDPKAPGEDEHDFSLYDDKTLQ